MTTEIEIPSADLNRNLTLDVTEIYLAESRVDEIALVNTHKAPELMTCFIKGYNKCVGHVTDLTAEAVKAENNANFRKAEIILEEVPRILKEKGVTGKTNEDYRNAVIAMDKKYIELRDNCERVCMYRDMFKGKLKSMENMYMAVRKVFGSSMDFSNRNLGSLRSESSYQPMGYLESMPQMPGVTVIPVQVTPNRTEIGDFPNVPPNVVITCKTTPTNPTLRSGFGRAKQD